MPNLTFDYTPLAYESALNAYSLLAQDNADAVYYFNLNETYIANALGVRGSGVIGELSITTSGGAVIVGPGTVLLGRIYNHEGITLGIPFNYEGTLYFTNDSRYQFFLSPDEVSVPVEVEYIRLVDITAINGAISLDVSNQDKLASLCTRSFADDFAVELDPSETVIYNIDHLADLEFIIGGYITVASDNSDIYVSVYKPGTETGSTFRLEVSNSTGSVASGNISFVRTGLSYL